jgi:hypothetical protein
MRMPIKLDHHHRHTVAQLFGHPIGHNIQWRDVLCLLERFGEVHESHRGGWALTVSGSTMSFGRTRGRNLTEHQVVRIRHLLQDYGVSASGNIAAA